MTISKLPPTSSIAASQRLADQPADATTPNVRSGSQPDTTPLAVGLARRAEGGAPGTGLQSVIAAKLGAAAPKEKEAWTDLTPKGVTTTICQSKYGGEISGAPGLLDVGGVFMNVESSKLFEKGGKILRHDDVASIFERGAQYYGKLKLGTTKWSLDSAPAELFEKGGLLIVELPVGAKLRAQGAALSTAKIIDYPSDGAPIGAAPNLRQLHLDVKPGSSRLELEVEIAPGSEDYKLASGQVGSLDVVYYPVGSLGFNSVTGKASQEVTVDASTPAVAGPPAASLAVQLAYDHWQALRASRQRAQANALGTIGVSRADAFGDMGRVQHDEATALDDYRRLLGATGGGGPAGSWSGITMGGPSGGRAGWAAYQGGTTTGGWGSSSGGSHGRA